MAVGIEDGGFESATCGRMSGRLFGQQVPDFLIVCAERPRTVLLSWWSVRRQLSRVSPPTSGNGAASPYPCAPFDRVMRRKTFSATVRAPVATTKGSVMGISTGQNSTLRMGPKKSCIERKEVDT